LTVGSRMNPNCVRKVSLLSKSSNSIHLTLLENMLKWTPSSSIFAPNGELLPTI